MNKEWGRRNMMTGKAGEYAVASKLYLLGVPVMMSGVDFGVDLVTHSGCKIQVKSAHLSNLRSGQRAYCYPFPKTIRRSRTDDESWKSPKAPFSECCDTVVLWGIEENRFWVISSDLADKSTGLVLGDVDPTNRFVGDIADMKEMKSLGFSLGEIARKHGTHATSVKQFLVSGKDYQEPSITSQVRKCEGNWDLILNFQADRKLYTSELEKGV